MRFLNKIRRRREDSDTMSRVLTPEAVSLIETASNLAKLATIAANLAMFRASTARTFSEMQSEIETAVDAVEAAMEAASFMTDLMTRVIM